MSEPVKPRGFAFGAGVLAAMFVVVAFLARPVPAAIVELFGAHGGGVDREGGLRVRYRPAPGAKPLSIGSSTVVRDGDLLVIEVPGVRPEMAPDVRDAIAGGGLTMREVRESGLAARIGP